MVGQHYHILPACDSSFNSLNECHFAAHGRGEEEIQELRRTEERSRGTTNGHQDGSRDDPRTDLHVELEFSGHHGARGCHGDSAGLPAPGVLYFLDKNLLHEPGTSLL